MTKWTHTCHICGKQYHKPSAMIECVEQHQSKVQSKSARLVVAKCFCKHGGPVCGAVHPKSGLVCTREQNHLGRHMACVAGGVHLKAKWR